MTSHTGTSGLPPGSRSASENEAEERRMSFYDLLFLAVGGMIGSGWLFAGVQVQESAQGWAVWSWPIGGAIMLVVAVVMVELGVRQPMTGGLTFLPFRTSGPYLALVIGAGIWVFYAVNPASEVAAVVHGLQQWTGWKSLLDGNDCHRLSWSGIGYAWLVLLLLTAVNLIGAKRFIRVNNIVTIFKIAVPLTLVLLLAYFMVSHEFQPGNASPLVPGRDSCPPVFDNPPEPNGIISALRALTQSAIFYAYLGFQGPLDLAGSVKRRGADEKGNYVAVRLRWAVYGAIGGSVLLYTSLQLIISYLIQNGLPLRGSPFITFVHGLPSDGLAAVLENVIHLDMIISPAGTAMVFTFFLTREVAQLSRVGLTHRGLWMPKLSRIPRTNGKRPSQDVYWMILAINALLSGLALMIFHGDWDDLGRVTAGLALIVYAAPCVVLAALYGRNRSRDSWPGWHGLAATAFVSISVIYFMSVTLWQGMVALAVGCAALFVLPIAAAGRRWYDAEPLLLRRGRHSAWEPAVVLFALFAVLTAGPLLHQPLLESSWWAITLVIGLGFGAFYAFYRMVKMSNAYLAETNSTLPGG